MTASPSSSSDIVNMVEEYIANAGSSTFTTFLSDRTPLAPLRQNAKGVVPKREPVRQRNVSDTDDDGTSLPSVIEQDMAFYQTFAPKREPIAVEATPSILTTGVSASASADRTSYAPTGLPLRDFYSLLLNELKLGRNGLGIGELLDISPKCYIRLIH